MRRALAVCAVVIGSMSAAVASPRKAPPPPPSSVMPVTRAQASMPGTPGKRITIYGGDLRSILPACRCVAGAWKLAKNGESKTHFKGTLSATSFNHKRAKSPKSLAVKVRKTNHLMRGVFGTEREQLHAIMRGSGTVMLREVTGGEWELVGFSLEAELGDLFANNARWRADPKQPPKAAPASAIAEGVVDGATLEEQINNYRASIGLPRIPISAALTKVARAHARDLATHNPVTETCNMHSWSANGSWSSCCYDRSRAAARCMWVKPKEIAGYKGNGYEIAARWSSGMSPDRALDQWQRSSAHHDVMVNAGIWDKPWRALGVAIEGDFAVAWFGEEADAR
jgi:hypothetical protein